MSAGRPLCSALALSGHSAAGGGPSLSLYPQHLVTDPAVSKADVWGRVFLRGWGANQLLRFEVAGKVSADNNEVSESMKSFR